MNDSTEPRMGVVASGLLWFGAAVSIAEIAAGMEIGGNWLALVLGHLVGGVMLFGAGLIGANTRRPAMATTVGTFGGWGMRFFAFLNLLQLIGWTSVMISQGGDAVVALTGFGKALPCLALAVLVGVWIFIAFGDRLHLATIAMSLLAVMAVVLTIRLTGVTATGAVKEVDFWSAFEMSAAMPLSWLPLISDYTSIAKRPKLSAGVSALVYTLVSVWMYALGMLLSRIGAEGIADGVIKAGIGMTGLAVVVFSTVTTTFLDAYSGGESVKAMVPAIPPKVSGVIVCAFGGVLAILGVMDRYIDFLYFISSVFAPMAAVLLVDCFLVKRGLWWWNLLAWFAGFVTYQFASASPIGPTLTSLIVSALLTAGGWAVPKKR